MSIITLSGIFLIVLVVIFIVMGIYFKKLTASSEDFLLAGRGAPFWLMAAAYLGGAIGGASVSGWTGYGFSGGMSSIWSAIFPTMGVTAFILIFARRLNHFGRRTNAVTITDFLCERYGERVRIPAAVISFFRPAFLTGMQYVAIALVLRIAFDWPIWAGVVVSAIVILAYLITAGQYSALVTQWVQAILQSLAIIIFAIAVIKMAGGMSESVNAFYAILPENFVNGLQVDATMFSVWFLTLCLFFLVDPWVYMWSYIGESPKVSQNAQLATLGAQFYGILVFISGMCVAVAVGIGALVLPEGLAPDAIYSYIALNQSTVPVGTFLIVGLLMTIVSCGSSFAMNGVTIITNDIYSKVINKNADEKQLLFISRISVLIVSFVGVAGALWLPILVPLWVLAQAIALSGLLAPVLCAWFWKRSTSMGAMASIIGGGIASLSWAGYAWMLTGSPGSIVHGFHAVHVGLLASIPLMVFVSLATKPEHDKAVLTSYKSLGDDMKAANAAAGNPDKPGLFGFLGAENWYTKLAWVVVFILFAAHFILVIGFKYPMVGHITMWTSVAVSVGMLLVFAILGGADLGKFFRKSSDKIHERV